MKEKMNNKLSVISLEGFFDTVENVMYALEFMAASECIDHGVQGAILLMADALSNAYAEYMPIFEEMLVQNRGRSFKLPDPPSDLIIKKAQTTDTE